MSDFQEGYNDGLAGAGMQQRGDRLVSEVGYFYGFTAGSLDRKAMLATAGDVMQPVNGDVWADGMGDGDA